MTLAKAFITGAVVKAPEKRFTQNDMAIAGFTVNFDPANEGLIRVVAFGQLAETISATVNIGDNVAVEGKLQVNSYKLPNGKDKKVFEIQASTVENIGGGSVGATPAITQSESIVSFNQEEIAQDLIDEDEIPF
ncbi:MAG: single-stranded DNA-binding protein [Candidatus Gastranaerophilales bacterium]|nr:single-stranded DNA-binding protein [Candidatus Gastranaerophilales bacterium]